MAEAKPRVRRGPKPPPPPDALVRQSRGRYRSVDERFSVRQDGDRWFVTDTQQTDDFGLDLVLGPFATIALARAATAAQRESPRGAQPGAVTARPPTRTPREPRFERPPKPGPRQERAAPGPAPAPERPLPEYLPASWREVGDDRDAVARTVRLINEAWTSGSPDAMRRVLDPDVVFVRPRFVGRETGSEAAIGSYREFISRAQMRRYAESDLVIDVRGHTAVATYRWEVDYRMGELDHHETGRDLFVLERSGSGWKLVWRLLLPDTE
jgi:ketosteroid isomerase-like protein